MKKYENKALCTNCGKCCKRYPGSCYPSDFNLPDMTLLKKAINSGLYTIDWWEGDPRENMNVYDRGYFVRPATKDKQGKLYDPTWGGECIFLTNKGCKLEYENRPKECRLLEPRPDNKCISHSKGKHGAALAWLKYYDILTNWTDS